MKDTLASKLFNRERLGPTSRPTSHRTLYSDRLLINELDIVDELDGHSGCVNALSWSKSGQMLASGSDDQHLNIHSYQSQESDKQFRLHTTVATGHTQNIFSTKFMPQSNDRTVITCAGDGEVRVFDLEYAGQARGASAASSMASEGRRRGRNTVYNGVRYLNDGDTNCRVYRSHSDRVKRIVTESSPHLFLTCSEDGEVRQWDMRQPSSAYPSPKGGRLGGLNDSNVPSPLISYKRYNLDLNTISCAASQPHYIALGGAHLHCFLHDRRMAGRDRLSESGQTASSPRSRTKRGEDSMGEATRCVRKFAPQGQQRMRRTDNGHITACKISDARPDEMIVSWSGDHIYSFNLVKSPDADESHLARSVSSNPNTRVKEGKHRKRKRKVNGSETSLGQEATARASSRPRTAEAGRSTQDTALRIRYQNGQQEDVPISSTQSSSTGETYLSAKQRDARRIAQATVKIRSSLFGAEEQNGNTRFTKALGHAASILSDVDQVMRDWSYPMDPSQHQVRYHQVLRGNRESARRFVQASGTLARVLGGRLQTPSGSSPMLAQFTNIEVRSNDALLSRKEQFGFDFLKAILLWLDSGLGKLVEGFTRPPNIPPISTSAPRLPIPESEATTEAVDDFLVPYLLRLASDKAIVNPESNRFELEENRRLFPSEKAAVLAFAAAVKIPFADLSSAVTRVEGGEHIQAQDRATALKYWALKAGRGVLLNAVEGIDYTFVDRAFGGVGRVVQPVQAEEAALAEIAEESEEEAPVDHMQIISSVLEGVEDDVDDAELITLDRISAEEASRFLEHEHITSPSPIVESGEEETLTERHRNHVYDEDDDDESEDDEYVDLYEDSEDEEEDINDDSSEPDEEDGVPNTGLPRFMYQPAFERRRLRERVALNVPCIPHSRVYRGHCNVKTVKDVNFFGMDDEYVVSGSDDGNLFIWDRKTSELVNVLEGDGEVVNVVQGHPYEPTLAVSGIDHTIKIFSPDGRARQAARMGQDVTAHDSSGFSSLAWPSRIGRRRVPRRSESGTQESTSPGPALPAESSANEDDEEQCIAPSGLSSRRRMRDAYRIMNQNDVERQGGNQDTFITRSMLHQLALRIRAQQTVNAGNPEALTDEGSAVVEDEDGGMRIVLGEDCVLM